VPQIFRLPLPAAFKNHALCKGFPVSSQPGSNR
jgi:hypothetical protein